MSEPTTTDPEIRAQVDREVAVQRRAGELAKMQADNLIQWATGDELAALCEAVRIYERDSNESFALADAAIKALEKTGRRRCGWCVLVLGDAIAPVFDDVETCQAHVHGCEHNPLVMRVATVTAALAEALSAWERMLPSSGIAYDGDRDRIEELRRMVKS